MACKVRCVLIVLCVVQIIAVVEKQVFDILCLLWTPILLNVVHTLLTVIALAGICRYIHKILVLYSVWCLIWTSWNVFVICFFYEVGVMNQTLPIMNLGCNKFSWFPSKILGCPRFLDDSMNSTVQDFSTIGNPTTSTAEADLTFHISTPLFTEYVEVDFYNGTLLTEPELATVPASSEMWTDETDILVVPTAMTDNLSSSEKSTSDDSIYIENDDYNPSNHSEGMFQSMFKVENASKPMVPISYKTLQGINAVVQCVLAILCFILTWILANIYSEEEDSFDFISGSLLPQNEKNQAQRYQLKALYVSTGSSR